MLSKLGTKIGVFNHLYVPRIFFAKSKRYNLVELDIYKLIRRRFRLKDVHLNCRDKDLFLPKVNTDKRSAKTEMFLLYEAKFLDFYRPRL